VRDYRLFWFGQLGHSASIWMEQVVRPLLVLALTGSALQVGLVIAARTLPMLVMGLPAGAVADRYRKQQILLYTQAVIMLTHLAVGLLVVAGLVEVWHLMLTAFIQGTATTFNQPTRQSLIPRLVGKAELLNAISLNQAAVNVTRATGPGLAGLLMLFVGYGEIYLLNAAIYAAVIWTTLAMAVREDGPGHKLRGSLLSEVGEGLRYVGQNPALLQLVAMAMLLFVLVLPYQQVFIPLLAEELGVGGSGVGLMLMLTGVGAVVGSLSLAARGISSRPRMVMLAALSCFALALIVLAQSRSLLLSLGSLAVAGSMSVTYTALNNTLLLDETPTQYHGRVMSLLSLDRGIIPVGAILAGALADSIGPRLGLTLMALACLLSTSAILLVARHRQA
jgi:MFS family permease